MKLIDREKLIVDIRTINEESMLGVDDCIDIIQEQPTVNTWIKYDKDNPPQNGNYYLCVSQNSLITDEVSYIYGLYRYFDGWNCSKFYKEHEMKDIIAYMPIPEFSEE